MVKKPKMLLNVTNNLPESQPKIKMDDAYNNGKVNRVLQSEDIDKSNVIKSKSKVKKILKDSGASNIVTSKRYYCKFQQMTFKPLIFRT